MSERMKADTKTSAKTSERQLADSLHREAAFRHTPVFHYPYGHPLHLQTTIGNQAVQRLLKAGVLQAKLSIGRPDDIYEQDADRVADTVMSMPDPGLKQQPEEEEEKLQRARLSYPIRARVQRQQPDEEEEPLQAKETSNETPEIDSGLESDIHKLRGGGQALPRSVRDHFKPRFGHDFSQVQIHTDSHAADMAQAVQAKAFTVGQDLVFGAGQYAPGTGEGNRLLAHELTHVMQQDPKASVSRKPVDASIERKVGAHPDAAAPAGLVMRKPNADLPVKRVILKAGERATMIRVDIGKLAQQAKDLLATDPATHVTVAYINSDGSASFLGPNDPCMDDRRLQEIPQTLASLGIPAERTSILYPPATLDAPKTSIAIDLYKGLTLSVENDYVTSAPKAQPPQAQPSGPTSPSSSLSDLLSFSFKAGDVQFSLDLPKSVTAKLPVSIGISKTLSFELKAETSGTFSFAVTLNGLPHFTVSIKAALSVDKDKGTSGTVGIIFASTMTAYKADNPEQLKTDIIASGGKLKKAHDEWLAAVSGEDKLKKLADVAGAIGELYSAVEKAKASAKPLPAYSFTLGVKGVLVPGPKTYDDPDPLKRPVPYFGGTFEWNF